MLVDTVLVDTMLVDTVLVDTMLVDQEHVNRKLSAFADNVSWVVPSHLRNVRKYPEFKKVCRL